MEFKLKLSAFSISWLRAYDFGLEHDILKQVVENLKTTPLVINLRHVEKVNEVDGVDSLMFDVRYQERSKLVRINLLPFYLEDQNLGEGRQLSTPITVNLLLDLASGFSVLNLCLPILGAHGNEAYTVKEVEFLTSQWLLVEPLKIRLPLSNRVESLHIREVMNYYFLRLHEVLWKSAYPVRYSPLSLLEDFQAWLDACREFDPLGCNCIRELNRLGLTHSIFPTSFGPIVDIWEIEDNDIDHFDADEFSTKYSREIAWIFTDGQRENLGESLNNERQTKSLALFVWPNHILYINQNNNSLFKDRVRERVENYGCLDVELIRIFEIINLRSALLHTFDRQLDKQLDEISSLNAQDQRALIHITEQRRNIARLTGSFDFFNLFHTAYWEPLYARLLEHPRLRLAEATNLVELKSERLDEEIQKAVLIQDRIRHQQEGEQELHVLRGLHSLSLANDIQSNALLIINFVVSATASFSFTEVLAPWLTHVSGAMPSFPDAYPLAWICLNIGIFIIVVLILTRVSNSLIQSRSQITELEGQLDSPYSVAHLETYLARHKDFEYFHLNTNEQSGYIRIPKPFGSLLLEFDRKLFYRFILLWQRGKLPRLENIKRNHVDKDLKELTGMSFLENAKQVLVKNDLGPSTKPSLSSPPHQWNWDSGFIAIGMSHYQPKRAEAEIRSLLRGQWQNGMIPQIIYTPNTSGYFLDPKQWDILRSQVAPTNIITSGITQPPVITIAVWEITRHLVDKAFIEEVYPALLAYHSWFHNERGSKGKDLVSIIHPWESGLDNSPCWAGILNRMNLTKRPTYEHTDNRLSFSIQRPSTAKYDRLVYLMDLARDLNYSQKEILNQSPFVVQDVLVNSILHRADECLRDLAIMIGKPITDIESWMESTRQAFGKLWDDKDAMYYDYDVQGENLIRENTIFAFLPMYAGLAQKEQAQLLVEQHLLNPSEYTPDGRITNFYLPTVSKEKESSHFNPWRYQRGSIWVNINWLVMQGLDRYGYADLAHQVRIDTLDLIQRSGFSEHFDPKTGKGYGAKAFSMSAALAIDLLNDRDSM